jgi:hypothetical protein
MNQIAPRTDLPHRVAEQLTYIRQVLSTPQLKLLIWNEVLTSDEADLVGGAGITVKAPPEQWVTINSILQVVAKQRRLSLECALLDLAYAVDAIETGQYQRLRRAVGGPVNTEYRPIPCWDPESGVLSFNGRTIRRFSPRATNARPVLSAFQEQGWPVRIDDPLPRGGNSRRLRETVRTLNGKTEAIKFFSDGKSSGFRWQEL